MIKRAPFLLIILFSISNGLFSQANANVKLELAKQAEADGEYVKAIEYYEDLYKQSNADTYFNSLLKLYTKTENYSEAEKLTKKRLKQFKSRPDYLVDLGQIYEIQKEEKKAEEEYENALKEIDENENKTRLIANKFNEYKKYDLARKTYEKGRDLSEQANVFQFELANSYAQLGETERMIEEYLTIVGNNRTYLQTVQNIFQRVLHPDPEGKQIQILKEQLLRRIQRDPQVLVFSELLIWLYIQDKNFNAAFIQTKALDRRNDENGTRLFQLADLSLSNKDYEVAEKCYNYIISLGEKSPYTLPSKMKKLRVSKMRLLNQKDLNIDALLQLKSEYLRTLEELGKSSFTYELMIGLADLEAYYLEEVNEAIILLNELIELPSLSKQNQAEAKILLGDLYILNEDIWEASLLYSQVDKDFKYDQLGETAKFKNAKIAFYTGDFFWAQAQLNVLKGSTSKLISNDAMDLSLLITDNVGIDSIVEPLRMYAKAELLGLKRQKQAAFSKLDSIIILYPTSSLKDEILFMKYNLELKDKNYELAGSYLEEIVSNYYFDILADDAVFLLAVLNQSYFDNTEKAMELYKKIITDFPSSLFVEESRKQFRLLRGDEVELKEVN